MAAPSSTRSGLPGHSGKAILARDHSACLAGWTLQAVRSSCAVNFAPTSDDNCSRNVASSKCLAASASAALSALWSENARARDSMQASRPASSGGTGSHGCVRRAVNRARRSTAVMPRRPITGDRSRSTARHKVCTRATGARSPARDMSAKAAEATPAWFASRICAFAGSDLDGSAAETSWCEE